MRKLHTAGVAAALLAGVAVGIGPAQAQTSNNMLAAGGGQMLTTVGAEDVAAMMTELGIATELHNAQNGGSPVLVAQTPGGGRFMFHFSACQNPAAPSGCDNTIVMAALPSAGVAYDDLNSFNGMAAVTTAVNLAQQQTILFGRNIIVAGGHSRDLFLATVYFFLLDVDQFVQGRSVGQSISYRQQSAPADDSKISGLRDGAGGPEPVRAAFGVTDFDDAVGLAIANTNDVRFSVDRAPN